MENIFVEFLPPWVETGLQPAFYDKESGTSLQQTARMYARVNMLIRMFNKLSKNTKTVVEDYINQFNELHDYVHDYFDNLDVQEEINNKLDAMVEDGTLDSLIMPYLESYHQDFLDFEKLVNWSNIEYNSYRDSTSNTDYYITEIPYTNPYGGNNIIRVGLANDDTTISSVEKPSEFSYRHKTPFVANAGIFYSNNPNPTAYGLVIKDGVVLKNENITDEYYKDIIAIKEDGSMKSYPVGTNPQSIINDGYVDAIVGFYVLIENGTAVDTSSYQDTGAKPRQCVCRKTNGDYLFLTSEGRTFANTGLTLADELRILGGIDDIDFAFELDGGGSTGTIVKSAKINKNIDNAGIDERPVATMLYVNSSATELYTQSGKNHNENQVQQAELELKYRQLPAPNQYFSGNLYNRNDPNMLVNKYIVDGVITDYTNSSTEGYDVMLSDYIQIPANSSFYCVNSGTDFKFAYVFDENKNWLYTFNYGNMENPVMNVGGRVAYVRVVVRKNSMATFGLYIGETYDSTRYEDYKSLKPVVLFNNLGGATSATLGYIPRYQKLRIYVTDSSAQQNSKDILVGVSGNSIYTFFAREYQDSTAKLAIVTARVSISKADGVLTIDREYANSLTPTPSISITNNTGGLKITRVEGY